MKKIPENKQESEGAERRQGASLLLADAVLLGKITAAMPGMDGDMWTLAQQTLSKLKRMTDSDYDSQKFYFTDENE